uniref:Uncharacterized protein n=1 Tax=Ciona savignyi TaxID=51511 RepID=H2YU87_CIOSA
MPRASHPRHAHHGQKHNLLLSKPGVRQPRPSFLSHSVRPRLPLQDGGFVAPHLRQHSGQMSGSRLHNRQPPRSQSYQEDTQYQEDDQYEEEMYYPSRDHLPRRDQPPSPPRHHSPISQMIRASPHLNIDRPSPHEIRRSPGRHDIRRSPPRHEVRPSPYANKTRRSPTRQAIRRSPPRRAGMRQENRHAVHGQVNRRSSVEEAARETGQETDMEEAYRLHREKLSRSIRERKIRQDEESGRNTPNEDDRQPLHDTSHQDEVLSEDPGYEEAGNDAMEQDMSGLSCLAHYLLHIKTLKSKKANEEI